MSDHNIFELQLALPNSALAIKEKTLLGFEERYTKVRDRIRLLLSESEIASWNKKFHAGDLQLANLIKEQYPLVIFYGDVGTGKTETAECIANRIVTEAKTEDSVLFKLSNSVRGTGKVGEMSSLIAEAFQKITASAGKTRRAVLIIDEGDSLGAARSQEHSHHEDKVAVNTLIQSIDGLRRHGGRIVTILCTNRLSTLDPALYRRAALVEEFTRPDAHKRKALLKMDLKGLKMTDSQLEELVQLTGAHGKHPGFTYSDIRTRLYPEALSRAFPDRELQFADLQKAAQDVPASPVLEDK
ncbi:AAA family ATPase [Terriglobus sp. RCC_193]|uniref:AAA family ATPase n=1 Tax=Terriglobus sp. RCC_193 TaxID=3239218 RepID=UPI0035259499